MYENWNGNFRMVNGRVKPPIVLRSETEMLIAQNAHNLIWDRHWDTCTALDVEIEVAERQKSDSSKARASLAEQFVIVKREIDALIIEEITVYRKEWYFNNLNDYIEQVESKLRKLEEGLCEVQETAEEAKEAAEDAKEAAEEAKEAAEDAKEAAEEAKETLQEMQDEEEE